MVGRGGIEPSTPGFSVRSLRRAIASRLDPLPRYRPGGGKILVRHLYAVS